MCGVVCLHLRELLSFPTLSVGCIYYTYVMYILLCCTRVSELLLGSRSGLCEHTDVLSDCV